MKDSGVEWIGEMPAAWNMTKLKYVYTQSNAGEVIDKGYWGSGRQLLYTCRQTPMTSDYEGFPERKRTGEEDLLLTRNATPYIFVPVNGSIYSNVVQRIAIQRDYVRRFVRYALIGGAQALVAYGDTIPSYNMKVWDNICFPKAPRRIQEDIADYLDSTCADIDTAIAEAKASVEEYKLLRQSVIAQAVTKGLDLNAPMKNSGVEWIGEIPLTWNRGNLKVLFSFGRGLPITKADLTEDGVLVVSYGQIHAKTNTGTCLDDSLLRHVASSYLNTNVGSLIYNGDIVFADTSEDLEGMGNAVLMDRHEAVFAGYHTIVARPNDKTMSTYLAYLFRSDPWRSQLRSRATGIKVFSITQRMLKSCTVILPPEPDRSAIVSYLNSICARIDGLMSEKQSMTSDLESYKKSLIYEVVTGKRRVA